MEECVPAMSVIYGCMIGVILGAVMTWIVADAYHSNGRKKNSIAPLPPIGSHWTLTTNGDPWALPVNVEVVAVLPGWVRVSHGKTTQSSVEINTFYKIYQPAPWLQELTT